MNDGDGACHNIADNVTRALQTYCSFLQNALRIEPAVTTRCAV